MQIIFSRRSTPGSLAVRAMTREGVFEVGNGWSHCAAILPGSRVIDSTWHHGVREPRSLQSYVDTCSDFVIQHVVAEDAWVREALLSQVGKPYDYGALAAFAMPGTFADRWWMDHNAWTCSELIAWALNGRCSRYIPHSPAAISPNKLALLLGLTPAPKQPAFDMRLLPT